MKRRLEPLFAAGWLGIPPVVWLLGCFAVVMMLADAHHAHPQAFLYVGREFVDYYGPDPYEFLDPAYNLLHGQGFTFEGRPTAFREPGGILFFALLFAVFGVHYGAILLGNGIMLLLAVVLMYRVGDQVFGPRAGVIASALMALNASLWVNSLWPIGEALFVGSIVAMLDTLLRYERMGNWRSLAWSGLWFAIATMTRSTLLVFFPVLLWAAWRRRPRFASLLVAAIPLAMMMTPWVVRNYVVFQRIIPTATRLGMSMANENGARALERPFFTPWATNYLTEAERNALQQNMPPITDPQWEIIYDDRCRAKALADIRAHPLGYAKRILRRVVAFYSPCNILSRPVWLNVAQAVKWLLAVAPGLFALWRWRREPWAQVGWGLVVLTTGALSVIGMDEGQRYRLTIEPVLMLAASGLYTAWLERRSVRPRAATTAQPVH